jgi:hypothetical protein
MELCTKLRHITSTILHWLLSLSPPGWQQILVSLVCGSWGRRHGTGVYDALLDACLSIELFVAQCYEGHADRR